MELIFEPLDAHKVEQASTYKKKIAVVGAGVAGLTAALVLAQRGNEVEVFEQQESLGGQLRLAAQVPGKEEFFETIRYYTEQLKHCGVKIHLNTSFELKNFQQAIQATNLFKVFS
jgi:2,4-dienoyl-CoA reductase (NADPH2)